VNKVTLLLIGALIALPFLVYAFDRPLTAEQSAVVKSVVELMLGIAILCFVVG